MPRKLTPTMTFDALEYEVRFTTAALLADPDSLTLADRTDLWIDRIDAARSSDRQARTAVANSDAARQVAGERLRRRCTAFGDDLYLAVGKDRKSPRWLQFFPRPVSDFVRQPRGRLVQAVRGWLSSTDSVLEPHRPDLERWSQAADRANVDTSAVSIVRGTARQTRGALAQELTRERDSLHDELSAIARERGLPRDWPDMFFRVEVRKAEAEEESSDNSEVPAKD
jgi:hypothetical protein